MLRRVTSTQLRAARGLLAWTVRDLARYSGVHRNTITNIETEKSAGDPHKLDALARALECAGVIFLDNGMVAEGGPGVRLRQQGPCDEGLHANQLSSDNDG